MSRTARFLLFGLLLLGLVLPGQIGPALRVVAKPVKYSCQPIGMSLMPGTYEGSFRIRILIRGDGGQTNASLIMEGKQLEITVDDSGRLSGKSDFTTSFAGTSGTASANFGGSGEMKSEGDGDTYSFKLASAGAEGPFDLYFEMGQSACSEAKGDFRLKGTLDQIFRHQNALGMNVSMAEESWSVKATPETAARIESVFAKVRARAEAIPLEPREGGREALGALLSELKKTTPEAEQTCVFALVYEIAMEKAAVWIGEILDEVREVGKGAADEERSYDELVHFQNLTDEAIALDHLANLLGCSWADVMRELGRAAQRLADDFLTLKDYFVALYAHQMASQVGQDREGFYQEVLSQAESDANRDFRVLRNAGREGASAEQLHQRAQVARTSEEIARMIGSDLRQVDQYCASSPELC